MCDGLFYVATWLGHKAQRLGQALGPSRFWAKQIKSIDFKSSRLPSKMCVGGWPNQLKVLQEKTEDPQKRKELCPQTAFEFKSVILTLPWDSSLPTCLIDYNCVSQFLKINFSLSPSLDGWMDGQMDIDRWMKGWMDRSPICSVSPENPD